MHLKISTVGSGEGQALASLYRWLSRDAAVARYGQVTAEAVGKLPGEMGAVVDVINAVFADAGAAAGIGSLLVAFRAWRDTRTQAPTFMIKKDGVAVVVNEGSEQEVRQILDAMLPGSGRMDLAEAARTDPEVQ